MNRKTFFCIFAVLAILIVATAIFLDASPVSAGAAMIGNAFLANPVMLPGRSGITIAHLDPETGRINVNAMRPYIDKKGMARIIANVNGQLGSIVTNAPALLRIDEWKDIDRTVIEASTQRLIGIGDLQAAGLTYNLGSIGVTMSLYEKAGDMTAADVSMSGTREGEKDKPAFDQGSVPVPIIHKDWFLNIRPLEASRRFGGGLDVTGAAIAGRVVAEKSEEILFNGAPSINVGGATIPGYTTHPNRNTVDMVNSWAGAATSAQIFADVQSMLAAARADGFYGPFNLYIPGDAQGKFDNDWKTDGDRTLRERVLSLEGISQIKIADKLASDNVVLVQMTRDVVDLAIAQDVTTLQWPVMGGMEFQYKTMAVWVPRIKAEFSNKSGVVHLYAIP
jgi:uncharacterized linocin/CFP29 family protein